MVYWYWTSVWCMGFEISITWIAIGFHDSEDASKAQIQNGGCSFGTEFLDFICT